MKWRYIVKFAAILTASAMCAMSAQAVETQTELYQTETEAELQHTDVISIEESTEQEQVKGTPFEELCTILKIQGTQRQPSLLAEFLGTENLTQAIREKGLECMTSWGIKEGTAEALALARMYSLIEDGFAELGIMWNPVDKCWNFHIGAGLDEYTAVAAEIYGDMEQLLLSCMPFYDGAVGIEAGNLQEQYEGSDLEDMLVNLFEISELFEIPDLDLSFYPEKAETSGNPGPLEEVKEKFQKQINKIVSNLVVDKEALDECDIYHVTVNTRDVLEIGQVSFNEIIALALNLGIIDYDDAMEATENMIWYIKEAVSFLGDTVELEFVTENDLLSSVKCSLVIERERYTYNSEKERVRELENVEFSCEMNFADPQNPMKNMEIIIDVVNKEWEDLSTSIWITLQTEEKDNISDTSLALMSKSGKEILYWGIPFTVSFDANTGDLNAEFSVMEDKKEVFTAVLDSTFVDVTKGESYVWNLDELSITDYYGRTSGLNGCVQVSAGTDNYSKPENALMLCDASRGELFTVVSEVMMNGQAWMEEIDDMYMKSRMRNDEY